MAGAVYLVNPRRKRRARRARKASSHRRRRPRARRRSMAHPNPRRRVRRHRRAHARRHVRRHRRNPRVFGGLKSGLMAGLSTGGGIALGAIGTNLATGALIHYAGASLPPQLTSGPGKMALKIGVGVIALPMLLKAVGQGKFAGNVSKGAWAAVVIDAYNLWVAPQLQTALGFSDYETGALSSYEQGQLMGMGQYPIGNQAPAGAGSATYAGGVYGEVL